MPDDSDGWLDALGARADRDWWADRIGPGGWPPRWAAVIVAFGLAAHALMLRRLLDAVPAGARPGLLDSKIFEYIGWYLTTGADLYVDAWEVKPPLNFEVTALLALLTPNVTVYHWANVGLSIVLAVASAVLAGAVVAEHTGDELAAVTAGLTLYALPAFHWRAAFGYKAKYLVLAAGLLAVWLALRDRPLGAGAAAGVAVATWQLAVVFPVLVAGLVARRGERPALRRATIAFVAVGVLTVAPVVVLWNAVGAMLVQVVFTPFIATEQATALDHARFARELLGTVLPVFLVGLYGAVRTLRRPARDERWWVAVGAAWYLGVLLFFDLDFYPDLFPPMAFVAVGAGLLVANDRRRWGWVPLLVAGTAAVGVLTFGGFGTAPRLFVPDGRFVPGAGAIGRPPYSGAEHAILYWRRVTPATCRIFFGPTQRRLIRAVGGSPTQETCGRAVRAAADAAFGRRWPLGAAGPVALVRAALAA
ncbi:MAG: DolP-mannose mannosyltransferase [Halobacteriaceae archaeon]